LSAASFRVVHALPGRIRVKVEALKGDTVTARAVRDVVGDLADVGRVEVSAKTGSVLVVYDDSATTSRRIAELAAALAPLAPDVTEDRIAELLAAEPEAHRPRDATHTLRAAMTGFNGSVASLTGGTDLAVLVPAGLTALGVGALVFGERVLLPEWYTLFWFAFGTFVALNVTTQAPAADVAAVEVLAL
jgi:hypothetical protein